jgi:hypothetical protein
MKEIEVYKWIYDNHENKENSLLGVFKMTLNWINLMNDYSFVTYGIKDGVLWKIVGKERTGKNGGTIVLIEKLSESDDVKTYLNFNEIAKEVHF